MQSKILLSSSLLFLSCLFLFCKKESNAVEESPFFDFFNESAISIDTIGLAADSWEYGFSFTPLKNGKITQMGIKLPTTGDFTATLWDLSGANHSVLQTKTVNSSAEHINAFSDIPEVSLVKNNTYGITVRSNAFYRMRKSGNQAFDFPRTTGNIRILSFNQEINNTGMPNFPFTTNDTIIAPCVNVIFIAD